MSTSNETTRVESVSAISLRCSSVRSSALEDPPGCGDQEFDDHVVAILDEVDVLEDESTLHSLYDLPNLTLVLITIDEDDLFAHFDGRLRSRFMSSEKGRLERYRHEELCDILRARIKAGLAPGLIEERTVEYIADLAAGDARIGIAILRRATKRIITEDEPLHAD